MPRSISTPIRNRALELYLEGKGLLQITTILKEENEGLLLSPETISGWRKDGGWDTMRDLAKQKSQEYILETYTETLTRLKEQHLLDYETMREKAMRELLGTEFTEADKAAKIADLAIHGQREVLVEAVQVSFLEDVISIIMDEVVDAEVRRRIGSRLRKLVSNG